MVDETPEIEFFGIKKIFMVFFLTTMKKTPLKVQENKKKIIACSEIERIRIAGSFVRAHVAV